jgi:hypothetical protein
MVVGLPGTGISSLLYIILALAMPFRELGRMVLHHKTSLDRWRCIAMQVFNAGGIMAGLWGVGWLLTRTAREAVAHGGASAQAVEALPRNIVSGPAAHLALVTLFCIVAAVEIVSFLSSRAGRRPTTIRRLHPRRAA